MEKKKKKKNKRVMKMPDLKSNPIMNNKAQDILFVCNAGIQMKGAERKPSNTACNWKCW